MLTMAYPATEVIHHVYMTMANQACRKVLDDIGILDSLDNRIYVNSSLYNPSKSHDQNFNPILVEDKFTCTFDVKHSSLGLAWDTTNGRQYLDAQLHRRDGLIKNPIFLDNRYHITMYDTVLPFNINMQCVLSLRDFSRAHEIIDRFYLRFNRGDLVTLSNAAYDFPVPEQLLSTLWALASSIGIKRKCFHLWLSRFSNGAIKRIVSNGLNRSKVEWVIKREVFESLIKIDYDLNAEPEKEGLHNSETLGISFNIILQSSRPSVLYLDYPIILNNTLVPPEVINVDTSYQKELYQKLEHPLLAMDPVYQFVKPESEEPAKNPWYDNWTLPRFSQHIAHNSVPFFIGAFTLDDPDMNARPCLEDAPPGTEVEQSKCASCLYTCPCKKPWCDYQRFLDATTDINIITDLDMYRLNDKLITYYLLRNKIALNIRSIYNIAVFVDDTQMSPDLLEFDGVVLKVPNMYGKNHIYRLVLSYTPPERVDQAQGIIRGSDPFMIRYVKISGTNVNSVKLPVANKSRVLSDYNYHDDPNPVNTTPYAKSNEYNKDIVYIPADVVSRMISRSTLLIWQSNYTKEKMSTDDIEPQISALLFNDYQNIYNSAAISLISKKISEVFKLYYDGTMISTDCICKAVNKLYKYFNIIEDDSFITTDTEVYRSPYLLALDCLIANKQKDK